MKTLLAAVWLCFLFYFYAESTGAIHGCNSRLTKPSGLFLYPENNQTSKKCKYKIIGRGSTIKVTCHDFYIPYTKPNICKSRKGLLKVGTDKFCGNITNAPNGVLTNKTLKFTAKEQVPNLRFKCTYEYIDDTTTTTTTTTSTTTTSTTTTTSSTTTTPITGLLKDALDAYKRTPRSCTTRLDASITCDTCTRTNVSEYYDYNGTDTGDYRIVAANGIPNHIFEVGQSKPNPNKACQHRTYMFIPKKPEKGDTCKKLPMGPVGLAISGSSLFNHLSTQLGDAAVPNERPSFDTCNGHSDGRCRYHYHMMPICIDNGTCRHIGYMADGFSVYTYCKDATGTRDLKSCYHLKSGETGTHETHYIFNKTLGCDLDEANGYNFTDGKGYAYVFTADYPFIMPCYYGKEFNKICYL